MLSLKYWKLAIGGLVIGIIVTSLGLHIVDDRLRKEEIVTLKANAVTLEAAVESQKSLINDQNDALMDWSLAFDEVQETMQDMADAQTEANEQSRRLNDVLGKHDLEALSLAKPGLIERTINRASRDVFRVLNDETSGNIHEDD